jgi:amino-acid N-acetyltransferase
MREMPELTLRKAMVPDIKTIHHMLMELAQNGFLLSRPLVDLYRHVREFYVLADYRGAIRGCCALAIAWEDTAEIRSLAVQRDMRGRGLGSRLVEICMSEAVTLGISKVFTLTYQTGFFSRLGYRVVDKDVLPNKIWTDCIHCAKFPDCDEIAMLADL